MPTLLATTVIALLAFFFARYLIQRDRGDPGQLNDSSINSAKADGCDQRLLSPVTEPIEVTVH